MSCDEKARRRAADPRISCLVRAPAGSGKTSLLVLRYLNLLQHVQKPEEVLCITFTNKATTEMLERILGALNNAAEGNEPKEGDVKYAEWVAARAVLEHSEKLNWNILQLPRRLNIKTLDSLAGDIVRSLPVAQLTAENKQDLLVSGYRLTTDDEIYLLSIERTLAELPEDSQEVKAADREAAKGAQLLLKICGGNVQRLHGELLRLLKTRDNWFPSLLSVKNEQKMPQVNLTGILAELDIEGDSESLDWFSPVRAFALRLVTCLALDMAKAGVADYTAVAMAADAALSDDDAMNDLMMALDYRYKHILVDEAQDLSPLQLRMLEKLVAGWEPKHKRTLMLVGDALQCCYGFRGARPGVLQLIVEQGIGPVELEELELTQNFRSRNKLVDYFNNFFEDAYPDAPDANTGATSYVSMEGQDKKHDTPVRIESVLWNPPEGEDKARKLARARAMQAESCIEFVRCALKKLPEEKDQDGVWEAESRVAILVRKRGDLPDIVRALDAAGIDYTAEQTLPYKHNEAVRTLMALVRCLRNPLDGIAHLALLRSPLCGLSLHELHAMASDHPALYGVRPESLRTALRQSERLERLSERSRLAVQRLGDVLDAGDVAAGSFVQRLQLCWRALEGPGVFPEDAALVREILAQIGTWRSGDDWDERMNRLLNSEFLVGKPGEQVQVMTIHLSKGLQFGAVFVPNIESRTRPHTAPLLDADFWYEDKCELAIAGIRDKDKPMFMEHLKALSKKREQLEAGRLLYIAFTRAIHQLGFSGINQPYQGTMLAAVKTSQKLQEDVFEDVPRPEECEARQREVQG